MPDPVEQLKQQIGDVFTLVEPCGNLRKPRGRTIYISPIQYNSGFSNRLGLNNAIEKVQEAGNNIYKVTMKL